MSHFLRYFLKVGREKIVLKKKEKEPTDSMRSRDYDLHITLDQYQFINEPPLGVFSVLGIWVKKIHEIASEHLSI